MKTRGWLIATFLVAAVLAGFGLAAVRHLPEGARLATHWDATGRVNGTMDPTSAVLFGPGMLILLGLLFAALPRIEPLQSRLEGSAAVLKVAWAGIIALFTLIQFLIVGPAVGWHLPSTLPLAGVGVLLVALGNVMPKSRPGFFVGVRTPWALLDTDNWIATQRLAGKLFIVAGVVVVLAALLPVPAGLRHGVFVGSVLIAAVVPVVWSWWLWRRAGAPRGR